MKKIYLSLFVLVSLFTTSSAQLSVEAGPDIPLCFGSAVGIGGSIGITAGVFPFTFQWSPATGLSSTTVSNPTANPQFTTVYYVTVTDSTGATATDSLRVIVAPPFFAQGVATNVSCFGGTDGMIDPVVTGGTPPYSYLWNNGMTTSLAMGLSAGSYSLTVIDGMGCLAFVNQNISQPVAISLWPNSTGISAPGNCDGSINMVMTGGVGPYTFTWSNGSTVASPTNLCAGTYTVTVTDANGCTATGSIPVSGTCQGSSLTVSISSQDLSCTHSTDTLYAVVTGGTLPYTYAWNVGSVGPNIVTSQAGIYSVWVTDSLGCTKTATDTLLNTGLVVGTQSVTSPSCNGTADGAIALAVSGGTTPYVFAWSNGATTGSLTGLPPGTYTVTVTDAASCESIYQVVLQQASTSWSYYVYVGTTPANCGNNGTATAQVQGGVGPFSYLWSNSDTTAGISGLASGTYIVTVTGANGCTRIGSAYITTTCYNVIEGYLFNDANGNCIKDSAETIVSNMSVMATAGGTPYYGYANNIGYYKINCPAAGTYTVQPVNNGQGCANTNVCGSQTVTFPSLGDSATANFGFAPSSGYDLALHPGWTSANPGFTKEYWILWYQQSQPAYTGNATVVFKYDSILQYQSHTQGGVHNATARTITWTVTNVPYPIWDWSARPHCYFTVPANTPIGYQLKQEFWITPTANDCDTSDNHLVYTQPVTGSLDPNEKEVSPSGDIREEDSTLIYTIHFQNTGNDTTSFIVLKDTLSPHLQPASVVNIASSHDYTSFTISDNGILTWLFNPIFLVDSATNEAASKGFVMFRVNKKPNLPLNTEIKNKASIYFDYNEAIVTNTVSSKLTDPNGIFHMFNDAPIQVNAAPNPFTQSTQLTVVGLSGRFDFELFDIHGRQVKKLTQLIDSRFEISREGMGAGVYFYSITGANQQRGFGRLIVE